MILRMWCMCMQSHRSQGTACISVPLAISTSLSFPKFCKYTICFFFLLWPISMVTHPLKWRKSRDVFLHFVTHTHPLSQQLVLAKFSLIWAFHIYRPLLNLHVTYSLCRSSYLTNSSLACSHRTSTKSSQHKELVLALSGYTSLTNKETSPYLSSFGA